MSTVIKKAKSGTKTSTMKSAEQRISRTKFVEILEENKGKIVSISYYAKDDTLRKVNGNLLNTTKLGYLVFNDFAQGKIINVNTRTLSSGKVNKIDYKIKK